MNKKKLYAASVCDPERASRMLDGQDGGKFYAPRSIDYTVAETQPECGTECKFGDVYLMPAPIRGDLQRKLLQRVIAILAGRSVVETVDEMGRFDVWGPYLSSVGILCREVDYGDL